MPVGSERHSPLAEREHAATLPAPTSGVIRLRRVPRSEAPAADALQRFGSLPLRFFLGLTFIYAGLVKIADPGYLDPASGGAYLGNQLQAFVASSPIGLLIQTVALPQIQLVGIAVVVTELVVGLLVLAGVLTRVAAAVGALLNVTLFLSVTWNIQPYFLAPDSIYAAAWITLALVGDGGVFSLQPYVQARRAASSWGSTIAVAGSRALDRSQVLPLALGGAVIGLIWLLAMWPKNG